MIERIEINGSEIVPPAENFTLYSAVIDRGTFTDNSIIFTEIE